MPGSVPGASRKRPTPRDAGRTLWAYLVALGALLVAWEALAVLRLATGAAVGMTESAVIGNLGTPAARYGFAQKAKWYGQGCWRPIAEAPETSHVLTYVTWAYGVTVHVGPQGQVVAVTVSHR